MKRLAWRDEVREQTREEFYALWDAWRAKIKRLPSVWAKQVRRIASGGPLAEGEDIAWDHAVMPHAVKPMDDADDPTVNIIVLKMARRLAKTEGICMNVIGRGVTDAPTNMISMWPVEDSADRFSRDVVEKTIEATPELRDRFVEKKSRDSGRTINFKKFHGGSLIINYAGSKSQTKGMAAGVVMAHEVDAYPVSSQGEGDPISKLFGRAEGFEAIKIIESTPTYATEIDPDTGNKIYNSNIEMWYDRSDQQKWFCPCRSCGARHWLKWEQIRAIKRKSGDLFYYICEDCDADHNERQWRRMVLSGLWMPTAPFINGVRGYFINGFNSLLPTGKGFTSKLHQFKAEGDRALNGTPEEKQVWTNEVKTEPILLDEDKTPPPPYQPILDGREDYATDEKVLVPLPGIVLTSMTDLHADRLEIEWRAWAKTEENWGCGHFVLFGDTNRIEVWDDWTKHLQRTFPHASGAELRLSMAFVDGGWRTDPVIATLRKLAVVNVPGVSGKIRISKGVPQWQSVVYRRWGTIKDRAKGVHIGTWCAKSLLYERLNWHSAKEKPSAGFIHYGKCYSDEFIRQTVSENPVFKIINGKNIETFKNPEMNRNEALDLLVGNLAAFRHGHWDFETIEKDLDARAAELKGDTPKKKPEVAQDRISRGRSAVTIAGWR
jgi:phage terminase large subunit GpA-like protein